MADSTPSKIASQDRPTGAESPTTARPLDFDDDQQETGIVNKTDGSETPTRRNASQQRQVRFNEQEEAPPAKPPRPTNNTAEKEATLIEAFPSIDQKVVKAVLVASGGEVEPAFNALLSMSDPSFASEAPPTQPARPTAQQRQEREDEMYARQLAQHYEAQAHGFAPRGSSLPQQQRPISQEKEYSFFDDELPEIRENLRQGFLQTQTKVNKWISDFKKKIDGDEEDEDAIAGPAQPQRQNYGPSQSAQLRGIRHQAAQQQAQNRRSTDHNRYDADPQVISDNFTELELRDDEAPPPKPNRPLANPNLFKPYPPVPPQSGPVDEVDALYRESTPDSKVGTAMDNKEASTKKKWQPLTSATPQPEGEDEHDPFSLGDSDDEETKKERERQKSTDLREEDTARLKRLASEKEGATPEERKMSLTEAEPTATGRNQEAEDLLKK